MDMLHTVIKDTVAMGDNDIQEWFNGNWDAGCKPSKKLAIAIDEATDIDLAAGLVSIV